MPQLDLFILPVSLSILVIFFTVYLFYLKYFLPILAVVSKLHLKGMLHMKEAHFSKNMNVHLKSYKFHDYIANVSLFIWNVIKKECAPTKELSNETNSSKNSTTRVGSYTIYSKKYLQSYYKNV